MRNIQRTVPFAAKQTVTEGVAISNAEGDPGADDADLPDNADTPAKLEINGSAISSSLSDENDVDWIRIDIPDDTRTRITVTFDIPVGGEFDINLFNEDGYIDALGYSVFYYPNLDGSSFDIVADYYLGDTYFVAISGTAAMDYSVVAVPFPDDYTGMDNPIEIGGSLTGTFELGRDEDWFSFQAKAGIPIIFTLTIDELSDQPNIYMDFGILDPDGENVFTWPESVGVTEYDPETLTYTLTFLPEQTGEFSLGLLGDVAQDAFNVGYTLSAEETFEVPGDTTTPIHLIPDTAPISAVIERPGDSDWYQLSVLSPMTVEFLLSSSDGNPGSHSNELSIYDADGHLITSIEQPQLSPTQTDFRFETPGTYYIGVQEYNQNTPRFAGRYTLTATLQDVGTPTLIDDYSPSFESDAGSVISAFSGLSTLVLGNSNLAILATNPNSLPGRLAIEIIDLESDEITGTVQLAPDATYLRSASMEILSDTEFLVVYVTQGESGYPSERFVADRVSNTGEVLSSTTLLDIIGAQGIIQQIDIAANPDGSANILFTSTEPQGEDLPDLYRVAMIDLAASGSVIRTTILAESTDPFAYPEIETLQDGTRSISYFDDASQDTITLHLSPYSETTVPLILDTGIIDGFSLIQVGNQFAEYVEPPGEDGSIRIFNQDGTISGDFLIPLMGVASTHYGVSLFSLPDGTLLVLDTTDIGDVIHRLDPDTDYLGEPVLLPNSGNGTFVSPRLTLLSDTEFAISYLETIAISNFESTSRINTLTFSIDPAAGPHVDFTMTGDDDYQLGTDHIDIYQGLDGQDFLFGLLGDDELNGGSGNDSLAGGNGSDLIAGGTGADKLVGGADGDTFIVGDDSARDWISDFDPLLDRISFAAGSGATGYGSLTFEQVDNDVLIHLPNGGTVGLADTILEELQAAMFNFLESSQENGQAEKPDQGAVIEDFLVRQLWRQPESAMDALPSWPDGLLNQDEISISADPDFPDDSGWQLG